MEWASDPGQEAQRSHLGQPSQVAQGATGLALGQPRTVGAAPAGGPAGTDLDQDAAVTELHQLGIGPMSSVAPIQPLWQRVQRLGDLLIRNFSTPQSNSAPRVLTAVN